MRRQALSAKLLGETYRLYGNPAFIRRAIALFDQFFKQAEEENRGKEVSTHRLGVITAMALAMELVRAQEKESKKAALLKKARDQIKELVSLLASPEEDKKP